MTKSTGIGRGKGGGRPRKHVVAERAVAKRVVQAARVIAMPTTNAATPAKSLLAKAYATLQDVMDNSPFPAPRVSAAKVIIEIAAGEDGGSSGRKEGKKAQADAAARTAGEGSDWGDDLGAPGSVN